MPLRVGISAVSLLFIASSGFITPTALGTDLPPEETSMVVIHGRQFTPDRTVLHRGQKTTLLFKNEDAELHTVVPFGLFAGMNPDISGNSAVEFEGEGFKRVIIPPDGTAAFHFTPTLLGEYRYVCDMPGHEMKGVIVVE
jgi:plastocyanin